MSSFFNSPLLDLIQTGSNTPLAQVQRATSPLTTAQRESKSLYDQLLETSSQPIEIKPIISARDATGTVQSVRDNPHTDAVPTNIDERMRQNLQALETMIDFTPYIGDIKGVTWDPIVAGLRGGLGAGLQMARFGLIGLIPGVGDVAKKVGKTAMKNVGRIKDVTKSSSNFIDTKIAPKLYKEETIKQKGKLQQGVQTLGVHRKYGTGRITGSQDVTDPDNIGPIKYGPSRINVSVEKTPKSLFQIENFNQYYTNPRGQYVPSGLTFDITINMTLSERPKIVGRYKDSNNIDIFPYIRETWPVDASTNRWLSNKDENYFWTDIKHIPIQLYHKQGGKIDENN